MYEYRAHVLRVVDGDTVDLRVDLGFDIRIDMKVRLSSINAPEMSTPEGRVARDHLIQMMQTEPNAGTATYFQPLTIRTDKDRREKYGRYLATLILHDGTNVNEQMVADGHATRY